MEKYKPDNDIVTSFQFFSAHWIVVAGLFNFYVRQDQTTKQCRYYSRETTFHHKIVCNLETFNL